MTITVHRNPHRAIPRNAPVYGFLGNLDGVHRGHQALIRALQERSQADGGIISAITFYPHPLEVLKKTEVPRITPLRKKVALLAEFGVDELILVHFTPELSNCSADDFIREYLQKRFGLNFLLIGEDAAVGKDREGDTEFLLSELPKLGIGCELFQFVSIDGSKIGSSVIRRALQRGEFERVQSLLGRRFSVLGRVRRGAQLGRQLGFPTANIEVRNQLLPPNGVYIARVKLEKSWYSAAVNVGVNPTVNTQSQPRVESYLLTYSGSEFYGEIIEVEFIKKLRDELRFDSVDELKNRVHSDIEDVREYFSKDS